MDLFPIIPVVLFVLPALHFTLALGLVWFVNHLAVNSWRRMSGVHWTIRARLLWPARKSNAVLILAVPVFLAAGQFALFPDRMLVLLLCALGALFGAILGVWPMARALYPSLTFRRWTSDFGSGFVIRFLIFAVLLAAIILMPERLGWTALLITLSYAAFVLWLNTGGILWLLRVFKFTKPAPERLASIVRQVAARAQSSVPRLGVLRSVMTNAVALPVNRVLLVTEGALENMPDDELAAVCAHEFGHLDEPAGVIRVRLLSSLRLLPALFVKPALEAWGGGGLIAIGLGMLICSRIILNFQRRMEKRADASAALHEGPSAAIYARALARIYEFNQVPAVLSGLTTHPNLYDRLVAAGVTPDFPRPQPPPRFVWQSLLVFVFLVAAGYLFVSGFYGQSSHSPVLRQLFHLGDN